MITPARIAKILWLLGSEPDGLRLTEIARRVEMPPSSCHILMRQLIEAGLCAQPWDSKVFTFGPALLRLSVAVSETVQLPRIAQPFLEKIVRECDEDAYLAVASGTQFFYAGKVESSQSLRLNVALGRSRPLHCTAAGKIFLAFGPHDIRDGLLTEELEQFTPHTVTDPHALLAQLQSVRQQGYSVQEEEHVIGVAAIAAPIVGAGGELQGALSSSVPMVRFGGKRKLLTLALTSAAHSISAQVGWESAA